MHCALVSGRTVRHLLVRSTTPSPSSSSSFCSSSTVGPLWVDGDNACNAANPLAHFSFLAHEPQATDSTMATSDVVAHLESKYPNLQVLKYNALASLQIKLRDVKSSHAQFKHYADRLMRYVFKLNVCDVFGICCYFC